MLDNCFIWSNKTYIWSNYNGVTKKPDFLTMLEKGSFFLNKSMLPQKIFRKMWGPCRIEKLGKLVLYDFHKEGWWRMVKMVQNASIMTIAAKTSPKIMKNIKIIKISSFYQSPKNVIQTILQEIKFRVEWWSQKKDLQNKCFF